MGVEQIFNKEPFSHSRFIFAGALADETSPYEFEQRMFLDYQDAYIQNVAFIAKSENAIVVPARVDKKPGREAKKHLKSWNAQNPFESQLSFSDSDVTALLYPQDYFVVGDTGIIVVHSKHTKMLSPISHKKAIIKNDTLAVGGRYVPGDEVVFAGLGILNKKEQNIVREFMFPNQGVIPVPRPSDVGMRGYMNVASHIDQFIGGAMTLQDGIDKSSRNLVN